MQRRDASENTCTVREGIVAAVRKGGVPHTEFEGSANSRERVTELVAAFNANHAGNTATKNGQLDVLGALG